MTKRNERRIRLLLKGNHALRLMSWMAKSGLYLKPITKGPGLHQHLFFMDEGLGSVVTHERRGRGLHTQRRVVTLNQMMKILSTLFATPENPPPDLSAVPRGERQDAFNRWFDEIKPKVFHPPSTRRLEVLAGPLEKLIGALGDGRSKSSVINLDNLLEESIGGVARDGLPSLTIPEDHMFEQGHRVGLTEDGAKVVFFIKEDLVMEVSNVVVDSVLKGALHDMGIEGFMRSMRRKGILPPGKDQRLHSRKTKTPRGRL